MRSMRMAAMLIACAATAAPADAQQQQQGSRPTREFVQAVAESDTLEIMEADTALAQSSNPDTLAFARQMIRDHGETSRRLWDAAAQSGLAPPAMNVGAGLSPLLAALQSQRGPDFDKVYWHQQMLAHRSALTVEQAYAASGDAPAVRAVAIAAIPLIQSHLAMAEQMTAKLGQ